MKQKVFNYQELQEKCLFVNESQKTKINKVSARPNRVSYCLQVPIMHCAHSTDYTWQLQYIYL